MTDSLGAAFFFLLFASTHARTHLKAVHRVEVRLSRGQPHDGKAAVGLGHEVRRPGLPAPRGPRPRSCHVASRQVSLSLSLSLVRAMIQAMTHSGIGIDRLLCCRVMLDTNRWVRVEVLEAKELAEG